METVSELLVERKIVRSLAMLLSTVAAANRLGQSQVGRRKLVPKYGQ